MERVAELDVDDQRDQPSPARRGRRRADVDPEVETFLRSSALRMTRVIQERNRLRGQAQDTMARLSVLEAERVDMIANFQRVNANCQASLVLETHVVFRSTLLWLIS